MRNTKESNLLFASAVILSTAVVLSTAVIVYEPQKGMNPYEFRVGEPAPRTLFSPLDFSYVNQRATDSLREEKSRAVAPVFRIDAKSTQEITEQLNHFFGVFEKPVLNEARLWLPARKKRSPKPDLGKLPLMVSDETLVALMNPEARVKLKEAAGAALAQALEKGVADYGEKLQLMDDGEDAVTVMSADRKEERAVAVRELASLNEVKDSAERLLPEAVRSNRAVKNAALEIFRGALAANLFSDAEETRSRRKKAADSVAAVEESVKKDELVVQRGILVTPEEKSRIDLIQKKLAAHKILNQILAVGLLALLVYLACFFYLYFFERRILRSFRLVSLVLVVFGLTLAVCKAIVLWSAVPIYLAPAALAPLLLTLLTYPRIGLLGAGMTTVLIAPMAGFSPEILLASLLSGVAGALASLKVRKRIALLKVGAVIGVVYFAVLFAFKTFQEYPFAEALRLSLPALANGFVTTTVCFLIFLPLLESFFGLTTDITLLELSDLNHPLLKKMVIEAPGTYHHSLVVSALAEAACEAIGANALLARVGCYFHDIGKIARSEYFTENQRDKSIDKHGPMTPTMSCLLIMNHVRDGIELGRKHKLRERILRFIPEHHGTGVIYYFYKKAADAARPGEIVVADDFRYPGPKPQSRETAVAMLADSTEAATRSVKHPTPDSIRQLVRKIINDKFIDGQLDACDLTLRDLHKIQETFVHNLMAIFHTRVVYPPTPEDPERPDLFKEAGAARGV